ncbi:unnamed protein product, partial [Leptidea sinapis]
MDGSPPPMGVAEYYAEKTLFITGATGFMGKAMVEKLLRCCPGIRAMYILLRPKKGVGVEERLSNFLNNQIFDKLREKYPENLAKLKAMAGDILEENFGLSDEHIKTLQRECQIVFHGAASVRFNMSLKDAVNLNIAGTYRALRLAEGMSKLEVFVHISTSYCRSDVQVLEEKLYACRHNAHHLMELVQWMEPELLDLLQKKITLPEPNTYGYTKCIAEGLVAEYNGRGLKSVSRLVLHENPFVEMFWFPDGTPTHSRLRHRIDAFLSHTIPAYLVDAILWCIGQPRFMVRVKQRVSMGLEMLEHYISRSWCFKNGYFMSLRQRLTPEDDRTFFTNLNDINWMEYMNNYVLGMKYYCLKEDPALLPKARKRYQRMYVAHKVFMVLRFL